MLTEVKSVRCRLSLLCAETESKESNIEISFCLTCRPTVDLLHVKLLKKYVWPTVEIGFAHCTVVYRMCNNVRKKDLRIKLCMLETWLSSYVGKNGKKIS